MFADLNPLETDAILALMQAFRDDPRSEKIDLGVGIWREPDGSSPVFEAVKRAEHHIWETQTTKAYTGMLGDAGFAAAVSRFLFNKYADNVAAAATVGGTSAVRQLLALTRTASPKARVWIPAQTWPNHWALAQDLGLETKPYTWLDRTSGRLATERILDDLSKLHAGDVVILHACCHNPTGADPDADLQNEMLALIEKHGAVPLIDAAYLGFAASPAADTGMIGEACARLPEVMVAFSGSKSFGLYRERVGLACVLSHAKAAVQSHLAVLNRMDFTFPPDHGARCVSVILDTPDLRKIWETELERIRETLSQARSALTKELRDALQSDRFDTCLNKRGMFLLLPLGTERVARLRHDHAIYAVGDGRINLAGITPETALPVARALARVLRD